MMKVGISGGSGLIGRALCDHLGRSGWRVTVFGRTPVGSHAFIEWDVLSGPAPVDALTGLDGFVHLAGEPIASGRWTDERKHLIRESRILGTGNLVAAVQASPDPPGVIVSSSAVGFYGSRGSEELSEQDPSGTGFLAEICRDWEAEALQAKSAGSRVALLRTGIVLSPEGGVLGKMLPTFRAGLGGKLGSGDQYLSWIHVSDHLRLIETILSDRRFEGPVNATSPAPVTNREFTKSLSRVLRRPAWFTVPGPALRLALGEMAETLLLEGQRVLPKKALELSFEFRFPDLKQALKDLLQ
jgi:uncharacterized protein (TIGR01777 family)